MQRIPQLKPSPPSHKIPKPSPHSTPNSPRLYSTDPKNIGFQGLSIEIVSGPLISFLKPADIGALNQTHSYYPKVFKDSVPTNTETFIQLSGDALQFIIDSDCSHEICINNGKLAYRDASSIPNADPQNELTTIWGILTGQFTKFYPEQPDKILSNLIRFPNRINIKISENVTTSKIIMTYPPGCPDQDQTKVRYEVTLFFQKLINLKKSPYFLYVKDGQNKKTEATTKQDVTYKKYLYDWINAYLNLNHFSGRYDTGTPFKNMKNPSLKQDESLCLAVIRRVPGYYPQLPGCLRSDLNIARYCISHHPLSIKSAPVAIKIMLCPDFNTTLSFVMREPRVFPSLPNTWKKDDSLIIALLNKKCAVTWGRLSTDEFSWYSDSYKETLERQQTLYLLNKNLKHPEIIKAILSNYPDILKNLPREAILILVTHYGLALKFVSNKMKNDEEIVIVALNQNPNAFKFLKGSILRYDPNFLSKIGRSYEYDSDSPVQSEEFEALQTIQEEDFLGLFNPTSC